MIAPTLQNKGFRDLCALNELYQSGKLMVDCPEVCRVTSISRRTLYRLIAAGLFPEGVIIPGTRSRRWRVSEVAEWVEGLEA